MAHPAMQYLYADFETGQELTNYTSPSSNGTLAALETYLSICEQYEDSEYLGPGW